jgi:2-oxoglutarate dehydrogenase E2 component (dihydrolipoamide succinyltransferase)
MSVEIRVPPLGESLVDAVVGEWLKQEGEAVSRGETVVLLETDKVNLDVTAEEDGVLAQIARQAGETVTVGDVLGLVSGDGAATAASAGGNGATAPAPQPPPPPNRRQPQVRPAPSPLGTRSRRLPRRWDRPVTRTPAAAAPLPPCDGWRRNTTSTSRPSLAPAPAVGSPARTC